MLVAGHTYSFRHLSLRRALEELTRLGFTAVEVWLGHVHESVDDAVQALLERELEVVAVGAGGFYESGGASPERALEIASAVRAPIIVACTAPTRLPGIVASLPPDITLCVENHWDRALARPDEVLRAISRFDRAAACLDTGHALLAGVEPARFAGRLGSRLRHIHLKEARVPSVVGRFLGSRVRRRRRSRPEPVFPGGGNLDVPLLAAALAEVGYSGAVCLEHEGPEPAAALAELLRSWKAVVGEG